ncbi:MAG: hypothetical protein BEN18_02185 [Epulopiscium sp. Nuni2H_MBin001]|nr:MAG: hypothetical protein BEN18_02185 [Epulopiscium sp. Nuni2H_MBin001]
MLEFRNFVINPGYFSTQIITSDKSDTIEFELSEKFIPNNDLIAVALSTLCGTQYKNIYMDLLVSTEALEGIKKFTQANVTVKGENLSPPTYKNRTNNIILNFSGGFDSLAALCIMPDNTKLVSIDFGHWFIAEQKFFAKFAPYTVKTNFRQLKYDKASWTFKGIASILYSEHLGGGLNTFGTILEATPYNFISYQRINKTGIVQPFNLVGLTDVKFTHGLTEVGTAMVLSHYKPELINDSLQSLSKPGSEKRYRKQLLTSIVSKKFNKNIFIELTDKPISQVDFGTNFALDFLALYELKHVSLSEVNATVINIPQEVIALVNRLSLNFYEKLNTNFLDGVPKGYRAEFLAKLSCAKIYPYNEQDWQEYREVILLLSKYHENLAKIIQ